MATPDIVHEQTSDFRLRSEQLAETLPNLAMEMLVMTRHLAERALSDEQAGTNVDAIIPIVKDLCLLGGQEGFRLLLKRIGSPETQIDLTATRAMIDVIRDRHELPPYESVTDVREMMRVTELTGHDVAVAITGPTTWVHMRGELRELSFQDCVVPGLVRVKELVDIALEQRTSLFLTELKTPKEMMRQVRNGILSTVFRYIQTRDIPFAASNLISELDQLDPEHAELLTRVSIPPQLFDQMLENMGWNCMESMVQASGQAMSFTPQILVSGTDKPSLFEIRIFNTGRPLPPALAQAGRFIPGIGTNAGGNHVGMSLFQEEMLRYGIQLRIKNVYEDNVFKGVEQTIAIPTLSE